MYVYVNILDSHTTRKKKQQKSTHLCSCKHLLICTLIWYFHFMLPIGLWICTCGFALLVYMHEYTSKCKRNVFGPVWVHMVAIYTPDPSGKPIWQWNITPVRMGKRIYVQLFRWCCGRVYHQELDLKMYSCLEYCKSSYFRYINRLHECGGSEMHTSTEKATKKIKNLHETILEKDQFLFVCCTLP